jgi:hypothetical protein
MNKILQMLLSIFIGLLTPEMMKKFADMVLDFGENIIEGDDDPIHKVCIAIRAAFDIPDND